MRIHVLFVLGERRKNGASEQYSAATCSISAHSIVSSAKTARHTMLSLAIARATDQRELEDTTEFVKDLICTLVDDLQG